MTFRARVFLAVFLFAFIPLAYLFKIVDFDNSLLLVAVFLLCIFALMGALAGAVKVDELVKSAKEGAARSEAELKSFMERVHDGIFRVDATGRISQINTAMAQYLRYESDFLTGKLLWDYLGSEQGAPNESFVPSGKMHRTCAMTGKAKTGGTIELLVDLYVQGHGGCFEGFSGCARPVGKTLELEKLREDMGVTLYRTLSGRLKDFLSDLNNVVVSRKDPEAAFIALEQATNRLRCRLPTCLEEGIPLKWRPELRIENMEPWKLLEEIRVRYEPVAHRRSRRLTVHCSSEATPFSGDFCYLVELLEVLIENALKYTFKDGEVNMTYRETLNQRDFVVTDNGIGMSNAELSRLFTPFFRADNDVNAKEEGLGLGLWAAHRVATAHGGVLLGESELGKGSIFTFSLLKSKVKNVNWIG